MVKIITLYFKLQMKFPLYIPTIILIECILPVQNGKSLLFRVNGLLTGQYYDGAV